MKIRNPKLLSALAYGMALCLKWTVNIRKRLHPDFDPSKPCIYCFWHGHLLLPIMTVKNMINHPAAGFVSYSKDGEILAQWLERMGYAAVRGSSSKKGIAGMVSMLKLARKGYSFGIAPDGPRGPCHKVDEGVAFLAAKSKLPIVPVGIYMNKAKLFEKSWDKFCLPKPFSKAVIYFSKPFYINEISEENNHHLKTALFEASDLAKEYYLDTSYSSKNFENL